MPKIVSTKLISRHYDDLLAGQFKINKTQELITQKYYWPNLRHNIKAYVAGYNMCLAWKTIRHKFYGDFQSLPVPIHQ